VDATDVAFNLSAGTDGGLPPLPAGTGERTEGSSGDSDGAGPRRRRARTTQGPDFARPRRQERPCVVVVWVLRRLGPAWFGPCAVWALRRLGPA